MYNYKLSDTFKQIVLFLFWPGIGLLCYYLWNLNNFEIIDETKQWGCFNLVLHSIPIYLYLRKLESNKVNFPFIETFALFNIIHFGLPIFYIKPNDFQLGVLNPYSLEVAFYAYAIFYISYYFFFKVLKVKPFVFLSYTISLKQLKSFSYFLLIMYGLSIFSFDSAIDSIGNVGFFIYVGLSISFWKNNVLTPTEKFIFIPIILFELVNRATAGLLTPVALLLLFIIFCLIISRGSKFLIIVGSIVFIWFYSIFSPLKADFRNAVWYEGKANSLIEKVELINELSNKSKNENAVIYVDKYPGKKHFLWRFSYQLSALSMVINKTPKAVPYWNGSTYLPLLTKFIPRILWADKPSEEMGYLFGTKYGIISVYNKNTSMNTPFVPELYINYGFAGIFIGCALLGYFYALLVKWFNSNKGGYTNKIIGAAVIYPLIIWESNFSLVIGNLLLVCLLLILLTRFIISIVKS